tara:strand:- start:187 stop:1128 length:942 start_codon:yes stop_codon:yes gene_type:complete
MRKIIVRMMLLSFFISINIFSKNINDSKSHKPYAVVLGIAQDGGYPHAGCERRCCANLWKNDSLKKMVSCISVIDPKSGLAWMIDATPDFAKQYHIITKEHNARLAGIFLTHAHIGHYTGLMHLGREVMGSKNIVVYAMPKMKLFLENNEPWKQLVSLKNIHIIKIEDKKEIILSKNLLIEPFKVPHRDEFSETVGYNIIGPKESLLYIPDIDKWDKWEHDILFWIESTSYALLDGTFYYDGEIPNRNMSEIPHPFIIESMNYFETLLERNQNKIFFIHLNHTNPAIRENSAASRSIIKNGFNVARKGMKLYL